MTYMRFLHGRPAKSPLGKAYGPV